METVLKITDPKVFNSSPAKPATGVLFLRSYDWRNGGRLEVTPNLDRARRFPSPAEAFDAWQFSPLVTVAGELWTADLKSRVCHRCASYAAIGDRKEVYEFTPGEGYVEKGVRFFVDVGALEERIRRRQGVQIVYEDGEKLERALSSHVINWKHINHVPDTIRKPGIVVQMVLTRNDGSAETVDIIADGNHRAARAYHEKRPFHFYLFEVKDARPYIGTDLADLLGDRYILELGNVISRLGETPASYYRRIQDEYISILDQVRRGVLERDKEEILRKRKLRNIAYILQRRNGGLEKCPVAWNHEFKTACELCGEKQEVR